MPQYVPVTPETHATKVWRRPANFGFAAREALVSLTGLDLVQTALLAPVAFVAQDDQYVPVMVMSPSPDRNLFVGPQGQWLGGYAPAELRGYPFRMVKQPDTDRVSLFVDEESGLVVDAGQTRDGEAFFESDGSLAPATKRVLDFLGEAERSRVGLSLATATLAEAGVIVPWPIKLKSQDGETTANGLFRVDEGALSALDADQFLAVRTALPLAYAQLLSASNLSVFERLLKSQAQAAPAPPAPLALVEQLLSGADEGLLRFD